MITYFIYDFSRAALEEVEGDVAELELKLDKVNFTLKVFSNINSYFPLTMIWAFNTWWFMLPLFFFF